MKYTKLIKFFFWFFIFFWVFMIFVFSFIYINPSFEEGPKWEEIDKVENFVEIQVKFYEISPPFFIIFNGKEFLTLSAICPFRRAILKYDKENKVFVCPSHGEKFDLNGNPLNRKVNRLKKLSLTIKGGNIYVFLGKGG